MPVALAALYQRIAQNKRGSSQALEELLSRVDVQWDTPLKSGVYTMLDAICAHPCAVGRQALLDRFERDHPPGHPAWAKAVFAAAGADWETLQRFRRCGANLGVRDDQARSLATHVVLRNDSPEGVACFRALRATEPVCATAEDLEIAWSAATVGCHPVFIAELLEMGCSPNQRLWVPSRQSHSGMMPAIAIVNHWRSFAVCAGNDRVRAAMRALDDHGVDWGARDWGESALEKLKSWGYLPTLERWRVEWASERADALDQKLPHTSEGCPRPPRF